jgi:hypothetical protein
MRQEDSIFFVGVRPTFADKRLIRKRAFVLLFCRRDPDQRSGAFWHVLCNRRRRTASPAAGELRLQLLAALRANPRFARRGLRGDCECAQRRGLEPILHPQLRPGFEHRQIAERARQVLIADFRLDARHDQNVAGVRNLQQRRGAEHALQRSDLRKAATSAPCSKASTRADPTTTPST